MEESAWNLPAGRYKTTNFEPGLSYEVTDGWGNYEDLSGQVLLVPPDSSFMDVDSGDGDYVGVYANAAAAAPDCTPSPAPGVPGSPEGIMAYLRSVPEMSVTEPRPVEVGVLGWSPMSVWLGGAPRVRSTGTGSSPC